MERLHKYMSQAGVASRREAERLIREGRVKVNGIVVKEMGVQVDSEKDQITLDEKTVLPAQKLIYLLFYKPKGVVTTLKDPQNRKKVTDYLKTVKERVYPVGRLDYNTEGLLLLTNDGELANLLTHPRHKVEKVYIAVVKGIVADKSLSQLRKGVLLEDGLTAPAKVKRRTVGKDFTKVEIAITEGRNRQVRRMFAAVGHPVLALKRVKLGPLDLGDLQPGEYRSLLSKEIHALRTCASKSP